MSNPTEQEGEVLSLFCEKLLFGKGIVCGPEFDMRGLESPWSTCVLLMGGGGT